MMYRRNLTERIENPYETVIFKSVKGQLLLITTAIMLLIGLGTSILGYVMFSKNLKAIRYMLPKAICSF